MIIETKDYLLLIDKEADLNIGDFIFDRVKRIWDNIEKCFLITMSKEKGDYKIIAYYPLHSKSKNLDLPLLPNPFKKQNIEEFSFEDIKKAIDFGVNLEAGNIEIDYKRYKTYENQFIQTFIKTPPKEFIIEYLNKETFTTRKIGDSLPYEGMSVIRNGQIDEVKFYSPNTSKTWQWVILDKIKYWGGEYELEEVIYDKDIKTIINSEGKKELVGKYIF